MSIEKQFIVTIECTAPDLMFKSDDNLTDIESDQLHPIPCEGGGIGLYCDECMYCGHYEIESD